MGGQPLRVALNARLIPGQAGGIETFVVSLIQALGELEDGDEEYVVVGPATDPEWLRPFLGRKQRLVTAPSSRARRALALLASRLPKPPAVPRSNGFLESLGAQVVHFPYQNYEICSVPTIYNPHDLQHVHFPDHFSSKIRNQRDMLHRTACHLAHTIAVSSGWVKEDVVEHYGVDRAKVQVIPWAPRAYPDPSDEELRRVMAAYDLRPGFVLYPAVTWPHKNHERLLQALSLVRHRDDLTLDLVLTGGAGPSLPAVRSSVASLELDTQVRFLGYVPREDLRVLYRLAEFVIVPTLFEAASGPVFEAWQEGTPVACSNVTSLPEQADGAALLFDPTSVEAIADVLKDLSRSAPLREDLRRRGRRRLADFSVERTAKAYRAVYRRAARRPLGEEDRDLLSRDWMTAP